MWSSDFLIRLRQKLGQFLMTNKGWEWSGGGAEEGIMRQVDRLQ